MDINDKVEPQPGQTRKRKPKPTVADKRQAAITGIVETLDEAMTLADTLHVAFEESLNQLIEEYTPQFEAVGAKLDEATQALADIRSEINETVGNLEEKFSGTERYERLSEFSQTLDSVSIPDADPFNEFGKTFEFDAALEAAQEAVTAIDNAKSELENIEIP